RIAHPFSLLDALLFTIMLRLDRGEPALALRQLEAAEALAAEQRLGFNFEPRFLRGAILSAQGAFEEGSACLREGLASRLGAMRFRLYGLVQLADALTRTAAREGPRAPISLPPSASEAPAWRGSWCGTTASPIT